MNFSTKEIFMFSAYLVTFTEEILNGKLHFFVQCKCRCQRCLDWRLKRCLDTLLISYFLRAQRGRKKYYLTSISINLEFSALRKMVAIVSQFPNIQKTKASQHSLKLNSLNVLLSRTPLYILHLYIIKSESDGNTQGKWKLWLLFYRNNQGLMLDQIKESGFFTSY